MKSFRLFIIIILQIIVTIACSNVLPEKVSVFLLFVFTPIWMIYTCYAINKSNEEDENNSDSYKSKDNKYKPV